MVLGKGVLTTLLQIIEHFQLFVESAQCGSNNRFDYWHLYCETDISIITGNYGPLLMLCLSRIRWEADVCQPQVGLHKYDLNTMFMCGFIYMSRANAQNTLNSHLVWRIVNAIESGNNTRCRRCMRWIKAKPFILNGKHHYSGAIRSFHCTSNPFQLRFLFNSLWTQHLKSIRAQVMNNGSKFSSKR